MAAPPLTPAADTTAPTLRTSVRRRQRVLRLRGAVAYARCNEAAPSGPVARSPSGAGGFRCARRCEPRRRATAFD